MPLLINPSAAHTKASQGASGASSMPMSQAGRVPRRCAWSAIKGHSRNVGPGVGSGDRILLRLLLSARRTTSPRWAYAPSASCARPLLSRCSIRASWKMSLGRLSRCISWMQQRPQPSLALKSRTLAAIAKPARATSTSSGTRTKRWISSASSKSCGTQARAQR